MRSEGEIAQVAFYTAPASRKRKRYRNLDCHGATTCHNFFSVGSHFITKGGHTMMEPTTFMNDSSASSEESRLRVRLFKLLAESDDELLLEQAKLTVFVCTRQRKQQLPQVHTRHFSEASMFQTPMNRSLRNELKIKLCEQIGDSLWTKAEAYTRMFEARKRWLTSSSSSSSADKLDVKMMQQQQQQQHLQQDQIPQQQQQQMMDQQSEAIRQALVQLQCQSHGQTSFDQNFDAWTISNLFVRNTNASFNSTAV
jgi:hypothetical protein